jgi:hypothetical protein
MYLVSLVIKTFGKVLNGKPEHIYIKVQQSTKSTRHLYYLIQSSNEIVESFGKWFIERFQGFSQVDVSKYLQNVKNSNVYGFVL